MLKFVRYFFIIFLITTVLPLVVMFFYVDHKMLGIFKIENQNMVNIINADLKASLNKYLAVQEGEIFSETYDKYYENMSLPQLKELFTGYHVDEAPAERKILSFYESDGEAIYSVTILPLKFSALPGIKLSKKVDLKTLHPGGPFDIRITQFDDKGNEVSSQDFADLFNRNKTRPHKENVKKYLTKGIKNNTVNIKGENGVKVATITILPLDFRPGPPYFKLQNKFGLLILFAGILSSFISALLINRIFIKPLLNISEATKHVVKGDMSFRLPLNSKNQHILDTYKYFNEMIEGLKEKETIRQSFISNLTHDLRTPLLAQERSLELIAESFKQHDLLNEYELAISLEKSNAHLLRMVNLILDSYSFDAARLKIVCSKIDLPKLVEGCYEKLKTLIDNKKITFINNLPQDTKPVCVDIICIKRIIINLISNAIENTSDGSTIQIGLCEDAPQGYIKIFVLDNGNGIPEKEIEYIFDRYYSGYSAERKLGTGLGLDVCKKLVEAHGGTIEASSKIGQYTKITLALPLFSDDNEEEPVSD